MRFLSKHLVQSDYAPAPNSRRRHTQTKLVALCSALVMWATACNSEQPEALSSTQAFPPLPAAPPAPAPAPTAGLDNPFVGAKLYVNPVWAQQVRDTAAAYAARDPELAAQMTLVADEPTAVWMDRISAIHGNADGPGLRYHLDAALTQHSATEPVLLPIVIYNLPGRDCFALASNGELAATDADFARYQSEYIDVIAEMLAEEKYRSLRIVSIIEPDSLPNLVTNADHPNCQAAAPYYRSGVTYALDRLSELPNVYNYIDAAHAGWLGWENNASGTVQLFAEVVQQTKLGFASVAGFVTNTANTTPLTEPFLSNPEHQIGGQPLKSAQFYEFNAAFDEAAWTADLYRRLTAAGFPTTIGMIIDTSRNGWGGPLRVTQAPPAGGDVNSFVQAAKVDRRAHRGAWCNPAGAGLGMRPQAAPSGFPDSHLDAFLWVKPPGESDGSATEIPNDEGKGFDRMCDPTFTSDRLGGNLTGALPGAPVSGKWFAEQFAELVANAYPPVGTPAPPAQPATPPAGAPPPAPAPAPEGAPPYPGTGNSGVHAGATQGCTAALVVQNSWPGGFQADISVTAGQAISSWQVFLALPEASALDSIWNGTAAPTSGNIVISPMEWNQQIGAGTTVTLGFTGTGSAPPAGNVFCSSHP